MSIRRPRFWGLHADPGPWLGRLLAALPFLLILLLYGAGSEIRHRDNPSDKLLPTFSEMGEAVHRMALTPDARSGDYLMVKDTAASLKRLGLGIGLAALVGMLLGLHMGLFPVVRVSLSPAVTFLSMVPPLAILPILFIALGVDELAKVMLIFIGTAPVIARDLYLATGRIPREQITKALTLGAGPLAIAYRILLPQLLPRLIDAVRLCLGSAWLFLIAAEAIASTDGLGYRIFLVRRYLAMDVILPYVLWITALGFSLDWLLRGLLRWRFAWYLKTAGS